MRKFRIARRAIVTAAVTAGLVLAWALPALAGTGMFHHG